MHDTVPAPGTNRLDRRGDRWMFLRARLKPGKTVAEAEANLKLLAARLEQPRTRRRTRIAAAIAQADERRPLSPARRIRTILPIAGGADVRRRRWCC